MTTLSVVDEVARLYRPDCPVEFIAASDFKRRVLSDPTWPKAYAMRFLAARPSAGDLECLAKRGDVPVEMLADAAKKGYRATRTCFAKAQYLRLAFMPSETLREMSAGQDIEIRAALRNPACPEAIVVRGLTSPSASIRWSALRAVWQRSLSIDSAYIRAAMELPMSESGSGGRALDYRRRVTSAAKQILASR